MSKTITSKVLSERAVLLHLSIGGWSAKTADEDAKTLIVSNYHVADASRVEAKKSLVNPKILKGVSNAAQRPRVWFNEHSVPWLDRGIRLIGAKHLDTVTAKLREFRAEWKKEVDALEAILPAELEAGKKELGGLGKDEDYPGLAEVMAKFSFEFDVMPVPDQRDIRVELSAEGLKETEESVSRMVALSSKNVVVETNTRVVDALTKLVTKLTEKGKKEGKEWSTFKKATIQNCAELVPIIRELNILDDPSVEKLACDLERIITPVSPEKVRSDPDYRTEVVANVQSILDVMEQGGYGKAAA